MATPVNDKNPYVNPDGTPIDGKEPEAFAWAREQASKEREKLSENERKEIEKSEKALKDRMNS